MYTGGDGYTVFTQGTDVLQPGDDLLQVAIDYITAHSPVGADRGRSNLRALTPARSARRWPAFGPAICLSRALDGRSCACVHRYRRGAPPRTVRDDLAIPDALIAPASSLHRTSGSYGSHRWSETSMHHRIAGILTGAVALSLVASGIAVADSVSADADVVVAGDQGLINLGTVAPGSTHQVQIAFDLLCTGTSHSAVNSTITLTPTTTAPTGGSMSATPGTIGPVPLTWPGAGAPCVDDPVLRSSTPSTVTLTAPLTAGSNIIYRVTYTKAPSSGISGGTLAQIALSVNANAAPELDLPGTMTVEGDTTGGWVAAYTATATDAEDDPDPAADCTPAPGVLLPLGTTTVDCSATDTAGATTTGSFSIHVVDTTPPQLGSMPSPTATTDGPGRRAPSPSGRRARTMSSTRRRPSAACPSRARPSRSGRRP